MSRSVYTNVAAFGLCSTKMQAEFRTMRDAGHKIIMYEMDGEWVNVNAKISSEKARHHTKLNAGATS